MSRFESLPDELTPQQSATLNEFRVSLADLLKPHHDDFYLLRWLKARNFDIKKAEDMFRKSMQWRQVYGADDILNWDPPEVLKRHWPGGVFGFDKEGHPILWQLSKDFDATAMMKCVKKSDVVKYHIYRMEKIMKICDDQTKKLGRRIGCAVHISDLDGFSIRMVFTQGITDMMKEIFAMLEANYPENLHSSYVINAPGVFPVFFKLLRPFLHEETKRKVHILGNNWKDKLFEVISPSEVPQHWGGSRCEPDSFCSHHIHFGGKIPPSFYTGCQLDCDRTKMAAVTVNRGSFHLLKFDIREPGTVIRWLFSTDNNDLGFGIFRSDARLVDDTKNNHDSQRDWEELLPVTRVNCQQIAENGNITCNRSGRYMLKFDNSYSWVASKKLYYDVEMMEPDRDSMFHDCLQTVSDLGKIIESTRL